MHLTFWIIIKLHLMKNSLVVKKDSLSFNVSDLMF